MAGLVDVFKSLSQLPNVKVLLSSRPWMIFEESFAGCPRLRLHELTRPDIAKYVSDQIKLSHSRGEQQILVDGLKEEIVDNSQGVFLWVYLVVRSLAEGLANQDSIHELRTRVLELPTDLENLYVHMWNKIPKRYQPQASRVLQTMGMGTSEGAKTSLIGLALAEELDETATLGLPVAPLQEEDAIARMDSMTTRLASRCVGLVEVHHARDLQVDALTPSVNSDCYPNELERKVGYPFVAFLHRTVFEFVSAPDMHLLLTEATASKDGRGDDFHVHVAQLRLLILRIKTFRMDDLNRAHAPGGIFPVSLEALVYYAIRTCKLAETALGKAQTRLLLELDRTMMHHYVKVHGCGDMGHWHNGLRIQGEIGDAAWAGVSRQVWKQNDLFSLAVRHNLLLFVKSQASLSELAETRGGRPLLDYALRPACTTWGFENQLVLGRSSDMVELLLENGAQPDRMFCGKSVLQSFIDSLNRAAPDIEANVPRIIVLLLNRCNGAGVSAESLETLIQTLTEMEIRDISTNEQVPKAIQGLQRLHKARLAQAGPAEKNRRAAVATLDYVGGGLTHVPVPQADQSSAREATDNILARMKRKFSRKSVSV